MNRDDYRQWGEDLMRRLPDLGTYLNSLPKDTRDCWFEDIFESHDLEDALAMNRRLMTEGEHVAKFDRDKLPSVFIRLLGESRLKREKRGRHDSFSGAMSRVTEDSQMGAVYRRVMSRMAEYRDRQGVKFTPAELVHEWVDDEWIAMEGRESTVNRFNEALMNHAVA
jgi:hypothetical protein